jgi:hypothetical protein
VGWPPLQASLLPEIDQTDQQDEYKKRDPKPPGPAKAIESDRPRKDVGSFDIKDKKKGGHQIKGDGIKKLGRPCRDDSAFIGSQLFELPFFLPKPTGKKKENAY